MGYTVRKLRLPGDREASKPMHVMQIAEDILFGFNLFFNLFIDLILSNFSVHFITNHEINN